MDDLDICREFSSGLGSLFVCERNGRMHRIRTPYLYPDGDCIDVFCKSEDSRGMITVSDLGETVRWLRAQSLSPKRSPKQNALLQDACVTHGVEFYKGMLLARCRAGDSLADAVVRVAQAAVRVSDLWFTFRTRSVQSLNDDVADLLEERALNFARDERIPGRSQRVWVVDFHVRSTARSSLVYVMSTGSRSAARSVAEHCLALWYDLSHLSTGPEPLKFVSLFDDTSDVWSDQDFNLVADLSTVARWSEPDHFAGLLADAAYR